MPRIPVSSLKNEKKEVALFKLGQAIFQLHYSENPDPYEKPKKLDNPATLLSDIILSTAKIRQLICTDPSFEPFRRFYKEGGITLALGKVLSDKNVNDQAALPDSYIQVFALIAWGTCLAEKDCSTPNYYAHVYSVLEEKVKGPIQSKLDARMVIAELLEKRILILDNAYLRIHPFLCRWLVGHDLCVPFICENSFQQYVSKKRSKVAQAQGEKKDLPAPSTHSTSPHDLYMKLKGYVVGNDTACKQLAVRGSLHLSRRELLRSNQEAGSNECLLIMGESGTGKTYMVETFGKLCGLPFASMSASSFTASGYVGLDPDDALKTLVRNAGDPKNSATLEKARYGVLFLDEWDKRRSHSETGLDVSGSQIQYEFLRMLSGTKLILGAKRNEREENPIEFNSNGTLFCFAGAFTGLDTILKQMAKDRSGIGFGGEGYLKKTPRTYDALLEYGMVSEFLNRITAIITMKSPDRNDLVRIATSPHGDIQTYNRILAKQGMNITIDASGVLEMAGFCVETKLYARGIRLIVSALVEETVFNRITGAVSFGVNEVKGAIARTVGTV